MTRPYRTSFFKKIFIKVAKGLWHCPVTLRDISGAVASQVPLPVHNSGRGRGADNAVHGNCSPLTLYLTFISYCPEPAGEGVNVPVPP